MKLKKMLYYLEENQDEKAVYKDIDFEKLYRELNKELLRRKQLQSA